eukprot:c21950_g1_i2.p1 GENE.c21950_g1_i2~~c21950_g1_i2.p1  ORF type:complete len:1852 (+),score=627.49 c21950_g1_i2:46-5601(+)
MVCLIIFFLFSFFLTNVSSVPTRIPPAAKSFVVQGKVDQQAMKSANDALATRAKRMSKGPTVKDDDGDDLDISDDKKLHIIQNIGTETGRYIVKLNDPIVLNFQVKNAINYIWTKGKVNIPHQGHKGKLIIKNAKRSDSGFYRCIAGDGNQVVFSDEIFVAVEGAKEKKDSGSFKRSESIRSSDPLQLTKCLGKMWHDDNSFVFHTNRNFSYEIPPDCSYAKTFCQNAQFEMCEKAGGNLPTADSGLKKLCVNPDLKCRWLIKDSFLLTSGVEDIEKFEHCIYTKTMHLFGLPKNDDAGVISFEYQYKPQSDNETEKNFSPVNGFSSKKYKYSEKYPNLKTHIRFRAIGAEGATFEIYIGKKGENSGLQFIKLEYSSYSQLSAWAEIDKDKPFLVQLRSLSENGQNSAVYEVQFDVEVLSKFCDLTSLRFDPPLITPFVFRKDVDQYDNLQSSTSTAKINLIHNENAESKTFIRLTVNGINYWNESKTDIDLNYGSNIIQLQLTAENGVICPDIYVFQVIRELPNIGDTIARQIALLQNLAVSCGGRDEMVITPKFDPEWFFYEGMANSDCDIATFYPQLIDDESYVEVNSISISMSQLSAPYVLLTGSNIFEIIVTAANRQIKNIYTVKIEKKKSFWGTGSSDCDTPKALKGILLLSPFAQSTFYNLEFLENPKTIDFDASVDHIYIKPVSSEHSSSKYAIFEINENSVPAQKGHFFVRSRKHYPQTKLFPGNNRITITIDTDCQSSKKKEYTITVTRGIKKTTEQLYDDSSETDETPLTLAELEVAAEARWADGRFVAVVDTSGVQSVSYGEGTTDLTTLHAKVPSGIRYFMIRSKPTNPACFVEVDGSAIDDSTHISRWIRYNVHHSTIIEVFSPSKKKSKKYSLNVIETSSEAALDSLTIYSTNIGDNHAQQQAPLIEKKKMDCVATTTQLTDNCFVHIDLTTDTNEITTYLSSSRKYFFIVAKTRPELSSSMGFDESSISKRFILFSSVLSLDEGYRTDIIVHSEDKKTKKTYVLNILPTSAQKKGGSLGHVRSELELVELRLTRKYILLRFNGIMKFEDFNWESSSDFDSPVITWQNKDEKIIDSGKFYLKSKAIADLAKAETDALVSVNAPSEKFYDLYNNLITSASGAEAAITKFYNELREPYGEFFYRCQKLVDDCPWEDPFTTDRRFLAFPYPKTLSAKEEIALSKSLTIKIPEQSAKKFGGKKTLEITRTPPATLQRAAFRFYGHNLPEKGGSFGEFVLFLFFDKPLPCIKKAELLIEFGDSLNQKIFLANEYDSRPNRKTSVWCEPSDSTLNTKNRYWVVDVEVHHGQSKGKRLWTDHKPKLIVTEFDPHLLILKSEPGPFTKEQIVYFQENTFEIDWKKSTFYDAKDLTGQPLILDNVKKTDASLTLFHNELEYSTYPSLTIPRTLLYSDNVKDFLAYEYDFAWFYLFQICGPETITKKPLTNGGIIEFDKVRIKPGVEYDCILIYVKIKEKNIDIQKVDIEIRNSAPTIIGTPKMKNPLSITESEEFRWIKLPLDSPFTCGEKEYCTANIKITVSQQLSTEFWDEKYSPVIFSKNKINTDEIPKPIRPIEEIQNLIQDSKSGGLLYNFDKLYKSCQSKRQAHQIYNKDICLPLNQIPCDIQIPQPNPDFYTPINEVNNRNRNWLTPPKLFATGSGTLGSGIEYFDKSFCPIIKGRKTEKETISYSKTYFGSNVAEFDTNCIGKIHGSACKTNGNEGFCHGCCVDRGLVRFSELHAYDLWLFSKNQVVRVWCDEDLSYKKATLQQKSRLTRSDKLGYLNSHEVSICEAAWSLDVIPDECKVSGKCSVVVIFGGADTFSQKFVPHTFDIHWDWQRFGDA